MILILMISHGKNRTKILISVWSVLSVANRGRGLLYPRRVRARSLHPDRLKHRIHRIGVEGGLKLCEKFPRNRG